MENPFKRRISIATCWASSRVAILDSTERYEDSYAITQEFREWIICLESKDSKEINSSVLKVPTTLKSLEEKNREKDEMLEL